ncbi:MAG: hypothetical protein U0936_04510 [Planctomycetaceae bacterium]
MRISLRLIPLLTLLLPTVHAQESGLELIPETAAAVIRIQAPEQITADLVQFINKVQPGFGGLAEAQLPMAFGQAIKNPQLAGVDQSKDWYVALFIDDSGEPKGVLVLPVTDADEAKGAMEETFEFLEHETWLICSPEGHFFDEFEDLKGGKLKSAASLLDDQLEAIVTKGHLTVAINAVLLRETFADELNTADDHLEELIQMMGAQIKQASPSMDMEYVLDMYRDLGRTLLQAVNDSESYALSIQVTDDALKIDQLLTVGEETATAAFFATQPVSDMSSLKSVPEGLMGYLGLHGDPSSLLTWSKSVVEKVIRNEEQKALTLKALESLKEAEFGTLAAGGDLLPEEETAMRYFSVAEIAPAQKIRDMMKSLGNGAEYEVAGIEQQLTYEPDAEKIGDQSVDIYRVKQTIPEGLDPTGMQKKINEKLYGSDGIVQRIMLKENVMLQTMGGGLDAMKQLVDSPEWQSETLLSARARQHENANLIVLVDLPNSVYKFAKLIIGTGALPIPIQSEQIEGLELPASYSGFSLAMEENRLSTTTNVSVETFQGFVRMAMFIQQMRQQQ